MEDDDNDNLGFDDDDAPEDVAAVSKALKVNPDGTVEQEDTVKYALTIGWAVQSLIA